MGRTLQSRVKNNLIHIIFLALLLSSSREVVAQTLLLPGDVTIVTVNASEGSFEIVPLVNLEAGTRFYVASMDSSWDQALTNRKVIEITIQEAVFAGSCLLIGKGENPLFTLNGRFLEDDWENNLVLFQKDEGINRFLFGIGWGGTTVPDSSLIATTLTPELHTWVQLGKEQNHQYHLKNGASGTYKMLLKMISNPANWHASSTAFAPMLTSFRLLKAPVVVFNESISTVTEGGKIVLNVAIYEHDGSRLTVDAIFNQDNSTADSLDIEQFKRHTFNFSGLIGDAVYAWEIPLSDDTQYEGNETAFFELTNLSHGQFGDFVTHAAFIRDNDPADVRIHQVSYTGVKERDYLEIQNHESVNVNIKGWSLSSPGFSYTFDKDIILAPFKTHRVYPPMEGEGSAWLKGRSGTLSLADFDGVVADKYRYRIEENMVAAQETNTPVEPASSFGSTAQSTPDPVSATEIATVQTKTEGKTSTAKGWFVVQQAQPSNLDGQYFFWSEPEQKFRLLTPANADSVAGKPLLQYINEPLVQETEALPMNLEETLPDTTEFEPQTSAVVEVMEYTLSATDADENGIINGLEGFNFITNTTGDSIMAGAFVEMVEHKLPGSKIHPNVILWPNDGRGWSGAYILSSQDKIPPGFSFWLKADSAFAPQSISFHPTYDLAQYSSSAAKTSHVDPTSALVLKVLQANQTEPLEKELHLLFYRNESELPPNTWLPQLFEPLALFEENDVVFGGYYDQFWNASIHLPEEQDDRLVIPLAVSVAEPQLLMLTVQEWTLDTGWRAFLEDQLTGEFLELNQSWKSELKIQGEYETQKAKQENSAIYGDTPPLMEERYRLVLYPPGVYKAEIEKPETIALHQNYPNPFNPVTTISFYLPEASEVRLSVFNVVGQSIAVLEEDMLSAGEHQYEWNAAGFPSGMYIYQLEVGTKILTRKMTLVK